MLWVVCGDTQRSVGWLCLESSVCSGRERPLRIYIRRCHHTLREMSDLNHLLLMRPHEHIDAKTSVAFHEHVSFVQTFIDDSHTVVGAIAWLTHSDILQWLADCDARIVVTNDRFSTKCLLAYQKLHVRTIGKKRGRRRGLMHHKFLVGCEEGGKPVRLLLGSFNFTNHALVNLENLVRLEHPPLAEAFRKEFTRLWDISKAIRSTPPRQSKKIRCRKKRKRSK